MLIQNNVQLNPQSCRRVNHAIKQLGLLVGQLLDPFVFDRYVEFKNVEIAALGKLLTDRFEILCHIHNLVHFLLVIFFQHLFEKSLLIAEVINYLLNVQVFIFDRV